MNNKIKSYILLKDAIKDRLETDFTVAIDKIESDKKGAKEFLNVSSNKYFLELFRNVKEEHRTFYEMILTKIEYCKMYFDLDFENDEILKAKPTLEKLTEEIFNKLNIPSSKIIILTAHGINSKGCNKESYHLIIQDHLFKVEDRIKIFNFVTKDIDLKQYPIDNSVYANNQNFRMIWNSKKGDKRFLKFENNYRGIYYTHEGSDEELFYKTLLTNDQNPSLLYPKDFSKESDKRSARNNLKKDYVNKLLKSCNVTNTLNDFTDNKQSTNKGEVNIDIKNEEVREALSLLSREQKSAFQFDKVQNNFIILRRIQPSHCKVCDRIHENQHPYIRINNIGEVLLNCRRNDKCESLGSINRNTDIFEKPSTPSIQITEKLPCASKRSEASPTRKRAHVDKVQALCLPDIKVEPNSNISDLKKILDWEILNLVSYCNKEIHDLNPIFKSHIINASMGTGKTKKGFKLAKDLFDRGLIECIDYLTFRKKLGFAMRRVLLDHTGKVFESYLDFETFLKSPFKICQAESLYKLKNENDAFPKTLLIIDESESFIKQMFSKFHKRNLKENKERLEFLLRESEYVVCLDADAGDNTLNLLKTFRPDHEIVFQKNSFKPNKYTCFKLPSKIHLFSKLMDFVYTKKKVVIVAPSKNDCYTLHRDILEMGKKHNSKWFPKIRVYTGEDDDYKDEMENINSSWLNFDIVIYNSVIGAGVSFEERHFDSLFIFGDSFRNFNNTVLDLKQMIGRSRNFND